MDSVFDFVGDHLGKMIIGVIALAVLAFAIAAPTYYAESVQSDCVVSSKDRTTDQDGNSVARVYTDNCGTFVVQDTLVKGQFDSADQYGMLDEGKTYDLTTYGYRVPFLSMFPNIVEAQEVSK